MSEELRKTAVVNSYLKRQALADEAAQYEMKPFVLPPLHVRRSSDRPRTTPGRRILPLPSLRRRTTAALDFPLHPSVLPNRNREGLCSPTRKNNPQPGGLAFQSPYNRHNRVRENTEFFSPCMRENTRECMCVCVWRPRVLFGSHIHPCIIVLTSQSYEIWQPNLNVIEANIPGMMEHLRKIGIL